MVTKYSIGDKVKHKLFGEGEITVADGFGDCAKLTIKFKEKSMGTKTIIAKYIKLIKK